MSYSSYQGLEDIGRGSDFLTLTRRCWRNRAYGDFWSYMLVAEGAVDIALEPELALHDMAALSVIVEEAGGRFTGLDGTPGPLGGNALATNSRLHDQVLGYVGTRPDDVGFPEPTDGGRVHDLTAHRQRASPLSPSNPLNPLSSSGSGRDPDGYDGSDGSRE
jgi:histidinol-phosphatase